MKGQQQRTRAGCPIYGDASPVIEACIYLKWGGDDLFVGQFNFYLGKMEKKIFWVQGTWCTGCFVVVRGV